MGGPESTGAGVPRMQGWHAIGTALFVGTAFLLVLWLTSLGPAAATTNCELWQITGTSGDDVIHGDGGEAQENNHDHHDDIDGRGGNDTIEAYSCHDHVFGGGGQDEIHGARGDDIIYGEDGSDGGALFFGDLFGGAGDDFIGGGDGGDHLLDTTQNDTDFLYGQADNDSVDVHDGDIDDSANGGTGGNDVCYVDTNGQGGVDGSPGCEPTYIFPI